MNSINGANQETRSTTSLGEFLNNHYKQKDNKNIHTHTRIGNTEFAVKGGSYIINNDEISQFYELYYKQVFTNNKQEYLTEKQLENGVIYHDLDLHYLPEIDTRQHDEDFMNELVSIYCDNIKKFLNMPNNFTFKVFIMHKNNVNTLDDKTKDGIHILINLLLPRHLQIKLREHLLADSNIHELFKSIPVINNLDSIFDASIVKASTNAQLFGSRKPSYGAYNLTNIYEITYIDNEFALEVIDNPIMTYELFLELCVRNIDRPFCELHAMNEATHISENVVAMNVISNIIDDADEEKYNETIAYINAGIKHDIFSKMTGHSKWINIAIIIKNSKASNGEDAFVNLSRTDRNFDEIKVREIYKGVAITSHPNGKPIGLGSLISYFKDADANLAKLIIKDVKKSTCNVIIEPEINEVSIDNSKVIADDDNNASEIIYDRLKERLFYFKGKFFLKLDHIWNCDADFIDSFVLNFILNAKIINKLNLSYSGNVCGAKHIREGLYSKIKIMMNTDDLYNKFHTTTKNRLCFMDGVLDFKARKFYLWEEVDFEYYTCVQIKRRFKDYYDSANNETINEVKSKIFDNMYGDKVNDALHFLSRAITGNYEDKNFLTYLGNRNCGKGVQYDALKTAFNDYVNTFELGNCMYNRKTSGMENVDCSKKLYWLLDFEFVRLGISQEIPDHKSDSKINGKIWKKITGGGDEIVARRNYDRKDTHFKIDTSFAVFGNNSLQFDTEDCLEHAISFNSVNQFKTETELQKLQESGIDAIEMNRYKLKDSAIKDKCKTEDWANAVVYLLYQNYKDYSVNIINDDNEEDDTTLLSKIKEEYIITNNKSDILLCDDIYSLIDDDKKKITNELQSINIFKKKCSSGEHRNKWCFYGIKLKPQELNQSIQQ